MRSNTQKKRARSPNEAQKEGEKARGRRAQAALSALSIDVGYPKPGPTGGRLARQMVGFLRSHGLELPVTSHILIATSAGPDSVALAHLLVHYGRRMADRSAISLLHINHGWRGRESDLDEKFVRDAGKRWGVPVIVRRLKSPQNREPQGWEDLARTERKKIFLKEAHEKDGVVFTAHHADDLAETVLWRLLTGSHESHGGGIAVRHGVEIRPLLPIRKAELKQYLKEEGESWREDKTNEDPRFLRARVRQELMPRIEQVFPRAVERLVQLGLDAQLALPQAGAAAPSRQNVAPDASSEAEKERQALDSLFSASGLRLRRSHWEQIEHLKQGSKKGGPAETHLPGGWSLRREPSGARWVLEKRSALDRQSPSKPKM